MREGKRWREGGGEVRAGGEISCFGLILMILLMIVAGYMMFPARKI